MKMLEDVLQAREHLEHFCFNIQSVKCMDDLHQLRTKCDEYVAEIDHLKKEMDGVLDDYRQLADKSKVVSDKPIWSCVQEQLQYLLESFKVLI